MTGLTSHFSGLSEYFTHFSLIHICAADVQLRRLCFVVDIAAKVGASMSAKAEEFYRKAEEAEAEAQRTLDYSAQQIYLEIAGLLRRMAALAERHEY